MTHAGRKPLGPALVQHLDGSERAKQRLEIILETITGALMIEEACQRLGIEHAMFCELRTEMLKAGLARLEPRPMGRPPQQTSADELKITELQHRVEELESNLRIAKLREKLACVAPDYLKADSPEKKTTECRPRKVCADQPNSARTAAASTGKRNKP